MALSHIGNRSAREVCIHALSPPDRAAHRPAPARRRIAPSAYQDQLIGHKNTSPSGPVLVVGNHGAAMEVVLVVVYALCWQLEMLGPGYIPPPPAIDAIARLFGYPDQPGEYGSRRTRQDSRRPETRRGCRSLSRGRRLAAWRQASHAGRILAQPSGTGADLAAWLWGGAERRTGCGLQAKGAAPVDPSWDTLTRPPPFSRTDWGRQRVGTWRPGPGQARRW